MINPKELRIGNLILWDGKACTVDSIQRMTDLDVDPARTGYTVDLLHYSEIIQTPWTEDLEPVKLTTDWLYSFDFDSLYWNPRLEVFWIYKGQYYPVMIQESRDGSFTYQENTFLKHVHQLQNLVYSITGEELTVKEKV